MPNQDQSFEEIVREQTTTVIDDTTRYIGEERTKVILAAHNAELLAVLEGVKEHAMAIEHTNAIDAARIADALDQAITKVKEGIK